MIVLSRNFEKRGLGYEGVNLLLCVSLLGVDAVDAHPFEELPVINDILLERVAHLVNEVDMHVGIVRVHLAATLVYGHEHRLDAACRLCHQRRCSRRCNSQTGDVASAVLQHVLVQLWVSLLYAQDERVVSLAFCAEYLECAALLYAEADIFALAFSVRTLVDKEQAYSFFEIFSYYRTEIKISVVRAIAVKEQDSRPLVFGSGNAHCRYSSRSRWTGHHRYPQRFA